MPCCKNWKLKRPRPSHFLLAEHLARGLSNAECSHLTGLSIWQVSRLKNTPLMQQMIEQARRRLLETSARALLPPEDHLVREILDTLSALRPLRDTPGSMKRQLRAAIVSAKLLTQLRTHREQKNTKRQEEKKSGSSSANPYSPPPGTPPL